MASEYYHYYHPATGAYYGHGGSSVGTTDYYYSRYSSSQPQTLPLHLCFFLSILLLFLGVSWYMSYESAFESLMDQLKVGLLLAPVLLLLALHCLSGVDRRWVPFLLQFPEEREALHRAAAGSPWGVAVVLVVLILMLSYRPGFQEMWFPLVSR